MKIYKGIIEENNLEVDLSYIGYTLSIEQILVLMKAMSPDFVEINDNIYLLSNYKGYGTDENRFDNSKQGKEKYINNISISDVFLFSRDEISQRKDIQIEIANYILHFWKMRLNFLFPNKSFEFLLFEDGLYDESGICMTFCQKS